MGESMLARQADAMDAGNMEAKYNCVGRRDASRVDKAKECLDDFFLDRSGCGYAQDIMDLSIGIHSLDAS